MNRRVHELRSLIKTSKPDPQDELWIVYQRDGQLIRERVLEISWEGTTRSIVFSGESTEKKLVYSDQEVRSPTRAEEVEFFLKASASAVRDYLIYGDGIHREFARLKIREERANKKGKK